MPTLEVPLKSGREIDIMWKDQIWEVKPFGTSATIKSLYRRRKLC